MATLSILRPTLLDMAKASDPDGKIATIVEILTENNEVLEDMVWVEGNLPAPTWRKLYGGVQPNKGTTLQVTDSCGMMEAYAEIDKALADLNGNTAAFRAAEDYAHIEGMAKAMASALFYATETTTPEKFTGLAPRFNSLSAANAENIIDGGGTGTDNSSIWLVVWGEQTCHGIIPKGSQAGLQMNDKGQVTIESIDGAGGRMEAYRTHYRWDAGLTVRDWRYIVRICNIDKSLLTKDASAGADLINLMTRALELVPSLGIGRPVFYMPRNIRSFLRQQMVAQVKQSTLSMEEVAGKRVLAFDGVPVKRVDKLAADEARIT